MKQLPTELTLLRQWCVAAGNGAPLNPRTGAFASPTDPDTWGTYEEALHLAAGKRHIGFVLSPTDEFTVIDLDNKLADPLTEAQLARHLAIVETFDTYTEISKSGRGLHIICRGKVPRGVRRDHVEIYSADRFMICTGEAWVNKPIVDRQELLDAMFEQMGGETAVAELTDEPEAFDDEAVKEMAGSATNAEKFLALWEGRWQDSYESQSEADYGLLSMLAFYSRSNAQVRRLFRESALGARAKAERDAYLNRALRKIRASAAPLVDLSHLLSPQGKAEPVREPVRPLQGLLTFPPGLVGKLAEHAMESSIRPVREVALCAALALCAGISGRAYNVSGTGLNMMMIVLARTGSGKEGAATMIDSMMAKVQLQVPMASRFIGPGAFASGQALIRSLDLSPCWVSVLGEFGLTLQQMCAADAQPALVQLKKVLLDLYTKSGSNKVLRASVYSDTDKNTKMIVAPAVTVLGESTPDAFFAGLREEHVAEGLLPRFSIVEFDGERPPRNPDAFCEPPPELVEHVVSLAEVALRSEQNGIHTNVVMDEEARALMHEFDVEADYHINKGQNEVELQLWNRAHLKALKLAALVAVGCGNLEEPVITLEVATWAVEFIRRDVATVLSRFASGSVGGGEQRLEQHVRAAIQSYLAMEPEQRKAYRVPESLLDLPIVPYHFLRRRLFGTATFRNDKRGAAVALEKVLLDMEKAEVLLCVGPAQAKEQFGVRSPVYTMGPTW